jgi:hypothetical protein
MRTGPKPNRLFWGQDKTFTMRIRSSTWQAVVDAAEANNRAVCQEFEWRVLQSFAADSPVAPVDEAPRQE